MDTLCARKQSDSIDQQICLSQQFCLSQPDDLHDNIHESVTIWHNIPNSCSQICTVDCDEESTPEIPRPSRFSRKSDRRLKFGSDSLKAEGTKHNSHLALDRQTQARLLAAGSGDTFFIFNQDQLEILASNIEKSFPRVSSMKLE